MVIQDPLIQKFQKTMKQYPPGTEIDIFKQDPNDWRCQNMWNGCKKLRQLCISSTQYDACTAFVHTIGINMPTTSPPDDAIISFWQLDQLNRIWVLPASKCNWENYDPKTWHAVMFSSVHQSFSDAPAIRPMPIETDPSDPTDAPQQPDTQQPPDQPDHPMPDPRPPTRPDENMSDPPDPPHQPDHPMPPAPRSVSPDSPVDPPLLPHDKPGGGDSALKRQKPSISSSSGLNRLGGDVSLPSQSQSSQPILPTVVVPSPPAILTNPEAEDHGDDLELPTLEQEETTGSPSKKQKTGKKKKKPDDNDESPEHSPRNEPASSSNYNPNNPANLPVQYESEKELIPHVPTSSGTGSSERTMRYTDQEDGESEDSQRTRSYDDHQADLVLDEAHWSLMTAGSFTVPRDIEGNPVLLGRVKGTFNPSPRCGFSHQKYTDQSHVDQSCKNMTDDDRALLALYSSKQEPLKASSTSALIGKKRKEATATEIKAYQKQFLEAKQLECKSWLDNEVFDLVDTRKIEVRNWVTGRWVLTPKRDKDGNFLKTKPRCWVLRCFQDKQKTDQQTASPAASRSGFRLAIQAAANKGWNIFHMDLKTAFLQGEAYGQTRDIICQIPPGMGYPPHIGA